MKIDMSAEGQAKYIASQTKLRATNQFQETDAAMHWIKKAIQPVADLLQEKANRKTRGVGAKYNKQLRLAAMRVDEKGKRYEDWNAMAYIGLTTMFQVVGNRSHAKGRDLNRVVHLISKRLQDEIFCQLYAAKYPAYYGTILKSFDTAFIADYRHKMRTLTVTYNKLKDPFFTPWETQDCVHFGATIVNAVLTQLPEIFEMTLVRRGTRTSNVLDIGPQFFEWINHFEECKGLLLPLRLPLTYIPNDWEADEDNSISGGYIDPAVALPTPFIRAYDHNQKVFNREHVPQAHMDAVNKMQHTAWTLNNKILEVQRDCFIQGIGLPYDGEMDLEPYPEKFLQVKDRKLLTPEELLEVEAIDFKRKMVYTKNKVNNGKRVGYTVTKLAAERFKDEERFHFVYSCDFRGRIYCCTPGLSPQGADHSKALLRFADGVPLGKSGLKWLAIHGANTFGNDKISNEDRVLWIESNLESIKACASDPMSNRWWLDADKPWQFLAFCMEYADADEYTISHLPVGLDGSCNGLQHYSAILRDEVGGSATNLVDTPVPADIYQEVADVAISKVMADDSEPDAKAFWIKIGITRKATKKSVMTLPYGCTFMTCRASIYEYAHDNKGDLEISDVNLYKYTAWLAPKVWASIQEVVIAATSAMGWIVRNTSNFVREHRENIKWVTPIDFPVYQHYMRMNTLEVQTQLLGRTKISAVQPTINVNLNKQKNGIAPNFVHSLDSTHMVMTINATDFGSYAMIHDDFGTHAGNTEELWVAIREQFVKLYSENDPLQSWATQVGIDTDLPERGTLDITNVRDSTYFFG